MSVSARDAPEPPVRVLGLTKRYGELTAVDGVDFEVEPAQIFCLVGPNGAGKTTTLECLEGLRKPDGGSVRVLGMDPFSNQERLQRRIGVQLQEANLPPRLRVWEALRLFSEIYEREQVPWELLDRLGLDEKRNSYFDKLSGGQKQRLFIALALINEPEVIFLDEITTGLDPHARQAMWELIRSIRETGTTVMLSTHFMDEAEALADRVAIMCAGRIVAHDTPANLISSLARDDVVEVRVGGAVREAELDAIEGVASVRSVGDLIEVRGAGRGWIARLVGGIDRAGATILDLRTQRPTLEEVYLTLTTEDDRESAA